MAQKPAGIARALTRGGRRGSLALGILCAFCAPLHAADLLPAVESWLQAQTNLHTWSADFVQTRHLKALANPLTASGRVWFAAPNRFRWELLHPGHTIAVRAPGELLVIYPKLKRAERYPLTAAKGGQWRDALALLEAGFPLNRQDLESRYEILSQSVSNHLGHIALRPRSASAARLMPRIDIGFATSNLVLRSTELQFADGSRMRNDFQNPELNAPVADAMFDPKVPGDYKVVEPLKPR